jgi:hypothetical protein
MVLHFLHSGVTVVFGWYCEVVPQCAKYTISPAKYRSRLKYVNEILERMQLAQTADSRQQTADSRQQTGR